jgi:DNA-binding transcriptional ArsR family regulator
MARSSAEVKAEILSALAHPNRIRILDCLRGGEKCNCELAPELGLEQSNLSRHLKLLDQSGILVSRKEGLRVFFRVSDEKIFEILELADAIAKRGVRERAEAVEAG